MASRFTFTVDVPMSRVKFNVNTEYAYLQNFKILQSTSSRSGGENRYPKIVARACSLTRVFSDVFNRHQIDRPIPVEQLVKCRMQDNLEFLQWTKKHWDQYYPGGDYDAVGRRKGSGAPPASTGARPGAGSAGAVRRGATPTTGAAARPRVGAPAGGANVAALQQEIATQKEAIAGLEKERDFYFAKLRDIELLLQTAVEADPELEKDDNGLVKQIQAILYSTEVR